MVFGVENVLTTAPAARRELEESPADHARRIVLGLAWSLKPQRALGVPATLLALGSHYTGFGLRLGELPDPERALRMPDGFAGICTDLSVPTLVAAYARGLFPFCHVGPLKWWAPGKRMALRIEDFHIEKNLRRKLRQQEFRVTFDRDFFAVLKGCADRRRGRYRLTWITPKIGEVYGALFDAGHAHSVEVWDASGNLVGGAYGVAVGGAFFTESQFTRQRDASKVGFTVLNRHLQHWGFRLNDGKHWTPHLEQHGFRAMPRPEFNARLAEATSEPGRPGRWTVDPKLDVACWDPKASAPAG